MKAASIVNEAYFDGHRKYFHFWGRFLNKKVRYDTLMTTISYFAKAKIE